MVACSARQQRQPRSREDRAVAQPLHHDRPRRPDRRRSAAPAAGRGPWRGHASTPSGSTRGPRDEGGRVPALDGDVMTIVEADQPDGSVGRLARTDRQPIIRDREFRSPRRRRDPSATRWRRGRGRARCRPHRSGRRAPSAVYAPEAARASRHSAPAAKCLSSRPSPSGQPRRSRQVTWKLCDRTSSRRTSPPTSRSAGGQDWNPGR
jgi:hypothetical protein